jgi:dienelactone hydrolase
MYKKEQLDVLGSPMELLVFEPAGSGPFPAVVVAQHLPVAHEGLENDPFTLNTGHGFQDFHNPDRYRRDQSEDAWARLFEFLRRHLQASF